MVVEHVVWRSDLTTWRLFEANVIDDTYTEEWQHIWELSWLKVHNVFGTGLRIGFVEDSLIHWYEFLSVVVSWQQELSNTPNSTESGKWFVEWIITNNILIAGEFGGNESPVVYVMVLHVVVIVIDSSEESPCLRCGIVNKE